MIALRTLALHLRVQRRRTADPLVPIDAGRAIISQSLTAPSLLEQLGDGRGLYSEGNTSWYATHWDVIREKTDMLADRFEQDASAYYKPYVINFETGSPREGAASAYSFRHTSWTD